MPTKAGFREVTQMVESMSGSPHFCRNSVSRQRVDIRAQLMWRALPVDGLGDGDHVFGRRNLSRRTVQPLPDMSLADFCPRFSGADASCQSRLATRNADRFKKDFFAHDRQFKTVVI